MVLLASLYTLVHWYGYVHCAACDVIVVGVQRSKEVLHLFFEILNFSCTATFRVEFLNLLPEAMECQAFDEHILSLLGTLVAPAKWLPKVCWSIPNWKPYMNK